MIIGYIKREDSTDGNVRDAYFLFGKREHHIIQGLFMGSTVNGKFYIDHEDKKSRIVLTYDNDDYRNEIYSVSDSILHLKNDVVYNDRSYTQTLIRSWPDDVPGTWSFKFDDSDKNHYVTKMITIKEPAVISDYNESLDDILYKSNQNFRQFDDIRVNLVGFVKNDNEKFMMYIRSDAKFYVVNQHSDYTQYKASYGYLEYDTDHKIKFVSQKTQEWQDSYDKQINVGSDSPTWNYSDDMSYQNSNAQYWTNLQFSDLTTKDLEDQNVIRFLHIYKADSAVMLVLERKAITPDKKSHHFFCFGK